MMTRLEFHEFIKSLGFKPFGIYYKYELYHIYLHSTYYNFYNGSEWFRIDLNDLTPLKKIDRNIKLKQLLG